MSVSLNVAGGRSSPVPSPGAGQAPLLVRGRYTTGMEPLPMALTLKLGLQNQRGRRRAGGRSQPPLKLPFSTGNTPRPSTTAA